MADTHQRVELDDGTGVNPPTAPLGSLANPLSIIDGYQATISAAWNSGTALNTALALATAGYDTVIVTIVTTGTITAGAVSFQAFDGVNWVTIKSSRTDSYLTDTVYPLTGGPAMHSWQVPVSGYQQAQALLSTAITGSGSAAITALVSSAPDVSLVTVGLDPGSSLPAGSNLLGTIGLAAIAGTTLSAPANYGTAPGAVPALAVNAAITNSPSLSVLASSATSGTTSGTAVAPATPAAVSIKASLGRIYLLDVGNSGTSDVWAKVFFASSVTLGTTSANLNFYVPKGTRQKFDLSDIGIYGATGLQYAVTGGISLTDNTAITASTVAVTYVYD